MNRRVKVPKGIGVGISKFGISEVSKTGDRKSPGRKPRNTSDMSIHLGHVVEIYITSEHRRLRVRRNNGEEDSRIGRTRNVKSRKGFPSSCHIGVSGIKFWGSRGQVIGLRNPEIRSQSCEGWSFGLEHIQVGLRHCQFGISWIGESGVERTRDRALMSINPEGHMDMVIHEVVMWGKTYP
jgi:hypothetical protein